MKKNINELDFIKVFLKRSIYESYYDKDELSLLQSDTVRILDSIKSYFKKHNVEEITIQQLRTYFLNFVLTDSFAKEEIEAFTEYFDLLDEHESDESESIIIKELQERQIRKQVAEMCISGSSSLEEVKFLLESYESNEEGLEPLKEGMEVLLDNERKEGLRWRLRCLNDILPYPSKGDLITIGARTNLGKTAFLASEVTHMASKLKEGEQVVWFNTEGAAEEIKERIMSATLGAPFIQIKKFFEDGKDVYGKYEEVIGGKERIVIYDSHGFSPFQIETILKRHKFKLIVFDMLDHVKVPSQLIFNIGDYHEKLYQWARGLSVKHCAVLATTQNKYNPFAKDEELQYPPLESFAQSATAKQAASKAVIMIGCRKNENHLEVRSISTPKNKMKARSDNWRGLVKLDQDLARFSDI